MDNAARDQAAREKYNKAYADLTQEEKNGLGTHGFAEDQAATLALGGETIRPQDTETAKIADEAVKSVSNQ